VRVGEVPGRELVDGVLLFVAGILLVVPGFIGDVIGLALLFPPTRSLIRWAAALWFGRRARMFLGASVVGGQTITVATRNVRGPGTPSNGPETPALGP
jgi:UPF0716 protein FxsA